MNTKETAAQIAFSLLNIIAAATADYQRLLEVQDDPAKLEDLRVELKARSQVITEGLRQP